MGTTETLSYLERSRQALLAWFMVKNPNTFGKRHAAKWNYYFERRDGKKFSLHQNETQRMSEKLSNSLAICMAEYYHVVHTSINIKKNEI